MLSVDNKSLDATDTNEPNFQLPLHSGLYSGMPLHVYPIPSQFRQLQQPVRSKRRQVKNACTHCQKACKKCDDARPCLRCVKYGISEECVDSQRKERKKGIKRGPYKKRDGKYRAGSGVAHPDVPPLGVHIPGDGGPPGPYMPMPGYPPGFYGHYPPLVSKQGNGQPIYSTPQFFLTSVPHPMQQGAPESNLNAYLPQGYYPLPFHPQYAMARADGSAIPNAFPVYPGHVYKNPSTGGQGDMISGDHVGTGEQLEEANGKVA